MLEELGVVSIIVIGIGGVIINAGIFYLIIKNAVKSALKEHDR